MVGSPCCQRIFDPHLIHLAFAPEDSVGHARIRQEGFMPSDGGLLHRSTFVAVLHETRFLRTAWFAHVGLFNAVCSSLQSAGCPPLCVFFRFASILSPVPITPVSSRQLPLHSFLLSLLLLVIYIPAYIFLSLGRRCSAPAQVTARYLHDHHQEVFHYIITER